jgi:peptidoglycan/LPS O-acetylase OafA/YrhL
MSISADELGKDAGGDASSLARIAYLDGWRGLAIACVLQGHFMPIHGFESGMLGVDVFFCLSGLLMARLLFVKRTPLKIFYERRFSRIIPVFFLYLFTVYVLAYLKGKAINLQEMLSTLTFLRTYYPAVPNIWTELTVPTGHIWSLNVEEHSYVFMSLLTLVAVIRKRVGLVLLCVGCAMIVTTAYYASHPRIAPDLFGVRTECAASFVMISAGYSLIKDRFARFVTPMMPVIALVLSCCCYSDWFPLYGAKSLFAPILLSFTANHLSEASAAMIKVLCFKPLRLLGFWSYSIYLWQQPFYHARLTMPPGAAVVMAVTVGAASFYLFENPTRRWLNERRYLLFFRRYDNAQAVTTK